MKREDAQKRKIPDAPGVYFFLGKRKEILYIGKATSLKTRVLSYFDIDIREKRSPVIERMVEDARAIEWTVTDSVLEAILLETNLIRTHKPVYNSRSKDDKSYNHVVITRDEFPRVLVLRGKDIQTDVHAYQCVFGPFPNGVLFKEALHILRKLFQFYDIDISTEHQMNKTKRGQIDFNRQIGLYPNEQNKREYTRTIRHIRLFFEGKKQRVIADLEREMRRYARTLEFEKADVCKKRIFALQHIQDVSLITDDTRVYKDERRMRIEAYDVAHMGGKDMVGVMTVCIGDVPVTSEYRTFHIKGFEGADDPRALREILDRRLNHPEWSYPDMIVVDGGVAQKNAAERVLKMRDVHIPVVGVVKDEKHNPKHIIGNAKLTREHTKTILLANAESHRFAIGFHRKKQNLNFRASAHIL